MSNTETVAETEVVNKLSETLKNAREAQGFSIETVAEQLNLSKDQIAQLEVLEKDIAELNPFERGYIRNYARFLDVDIQEFEAQFPDGIGISSELHSVERYSYKVGVPVMNRSWVKWLIYILVFVIILAVLATMDINFDVMDSADSVSQEAQIVLPEISTEPASTE